MENKVESVQTFGRKKTATAVAYCKKGSGMIKVNGCPISLLQPEILRIKTFEPVFLLGADKFAEVDIRVRCKGGGTTSQIYAIRQAIAKAIVAYPKPHRHTTCAKPCQTVSQVSQGHCGPPIVGQRPI